ncbi:MAG TPA: gluconate 2-dehydrogenase subunit 3 family protein [Vicinamibacteria bacterium]
MSENSRRDLLKLVGAAPLAAGLTLREANAAVAHQHAAAETKAATAAGKAYAPKFYSAHEWKTVRLLSDLVIPKDERSGGATDALVPEFLDQWMLDPLATEREREGRQTAMRGGLLWLDAECADRFSGRTFLDCSETERTAVLDDIAWPEKARPEMSQGVSFFTSFRDLVATGFWSSQMGVKDLDYRGNVFVAEWKGPPREVLEKLGLPTD